MRFSVSATLDAVEARLRLDPALARAVVDLAEVVRLVDLDGATGRPASLLRLGHVIDALAGHLGEDGVAVYPVVGRSLLSDLDLTSNERMAVRRWADDGRVEVLDEPGDRVPQLAELLGIPAVTRRTYAELADRYPWLPGGLLVPTGAGLSARPGRPPERAGTKVLTRLWRCPQPECVGFGTPAPHQPPPRLVAGAPTCPRHRDRLAEAGPRPAARVLAVRVDGAVRCRFVVRDGAPVVVGRAPETGLALASWLGEPAMRWVSRSHLRLELRGDTLTAHDTSTNGTTVRTRSGAVVLVAGQSHRVGADDLVELYQAVELGDPARLAGGGPAPSSIMGEAPTIAIRLPD